MKIFSSFDTWLKKKRLTDFQHEYGDEHVHLVRRSRIFLRLKVFFPVIQGVLFTSILGIALWYVFHSNTAVLVGVIAGTLLSIMFYSVAFNAYLDYTMDYCIITPDEIILTQQHGLFQRSVRTLDVAKVKSITINKKELLYSIFDAWQMTFMSEGDDQFWEIIFDFVKNPEDQKERIQHIISKSHSQEE